LCGRAEANGRETRRTAREGSTREKRREEGGDEGRKEREKGKESKKLRFGFLPSDFANGGLVSLL
jgi:hypothetical protein